jgi:hypothetical protein
LTSLAFLCFWYCFTGVPAVLAHEATHAAVGRLLGADVEAGAEDGRAYVDLTWPRGTPSLAIVATHLAPTLVGLGLLLVLLATVGLPRPASIAEASIGYLALLVLLATQWAVFTYPSREDRRPLRRLR